jgi:hypothetical protein
MIYSRHLERARIVFAIENEMSTEERNLTANKYWTNVDGERYLQVEEVDDQCFRDDADSDQDTDHLKLTIAEQIKDEVDEHSLTEL